MSEAASQFRISPDGRWLVWVKTLGDNDKNERVSNLVLSSLTEKNEIQMTRGSDNCVNPRWSPDGKLIAFVTTRPDPKATEKPDPQDDPKPQVWLINPFGGEPWPVTSFVRGVSNYEWADDDTIIFAAQEEPALYEKTIKEKKDTSIIVEDEEHAPPARLFKYSIKAKEFKRLTDNTDRIQAFGLSPGGSKAVTSHDRSLRFVYDNKIKPITFLYDLKTGERKQIFEDRRFNIGAIKWTRDGAGFYVENQYTTSPDYVMATIGEVYYYELAGGRETRVDLAWKNGFTGDFEVIDGGFVAVLADGARHRLARYIKSGNTWRREMIDGDHSRHIMSFEVAGDSRTVVYHHSTASTPPQLYKGSIDGNVLASPFQVSDLNPALAKKPIARSELIRWRGALDEEVEGILYYPHDYREGRQYALVVMIHGGPAGADYDEWDESWAYSANLMCQRGAFVMKPNYHGSSDYGLEWVESIGGGKYYDLEVPDIEKGVDSLIARGLIDQDKLGIMGWSNGSILTIATTLNSPRYKVASAGAGDVEWTSDWGNAHFGAAFDNYYLGKSPLEDPKLYMEKSPFYRMDRLVTPTIIFFGTEDTNVPTQQGWMHYRAIQQIGKTDVRFVLFPGEKHGPRKLAHQRRKLEEEMAWFDRYLFKTFKKEDESLKPDSPLAIALRLKGARADGSRFGVVDNGRLIPETVQRENLEIGRFEVTRAQHAEFDRSYRVEPGRENYPANDISFEQARAYCEWLSRTTGRAYRLATEEEAGKIYAGAEGMENNLDYWAGYSVNPDDAVHLRAKISELGAGAPLLREVGSFKGTGKEDAMLFDLNGNVAEWVVAADGTGRLMGASADTPGDPKLRTRSPAREYVGFRVVSESPNPKR